MAKGAEDRAFYRYLPLPSLCEVGGAPGDFFMAIEAFHRYQVEIQELAPRTMLAGTTHDTKRSEGVRARSLALAEIADEWASTVRRWVDSHDTHDVDAPTVLLALHTAVTAWPITADRMTEYLVKSAREADVHTSWTDPDESYESALASLAGDLEAELSLDPDDPVLGTLVNRTLRPGWANSLALLAVRLTSPGVPDLYQGTVSFTYSLVDPDNRVEPDWHERRALVDAAASLDGPSAWSGDDVESAKAVVITRTLALRRRRIEAFDGSAGYLPLEVTGDHADSVLAFVRTAPAVGPVVATVVAMRSVESWGDTAVQMPAGTWSDVLTDDASVVTGGAAVPVSRWLDAFPVAVLDRTDA
jgi:(1->4)-alpha-D-glucan 1-alpha-D-glucosylmutase